MLYLNVPPSSKVLRWKSAIQEFDCEVEHLAGVKNVVADGFSRLLDSLSNQPSRAEVAAITRQSTRISQQTQSTQSNSAQNIEEESEANTYIPLPDNIYKKI